MRVYAEIDMQIQINICVMLKELDCVPILVDGHQSEEFKHIHCFRIPIMKFMTINIPWFDHDTDVCFT